MEAARHAYLPLAKLKPSPLNHRKVFDKEKMKELAESIRVQGVIQPILARPLNGAGDFEVVAGERRYRAAKDAGLAEIPAVVRELTDAQALELQVIENGQRVDVHPLEEAEGYEALLRCDGAKGAKYTVDDIAAKVGKSRSSIFARLKLLALCPEGRKALYEGELDASRALLIARIGHHDTQRQALKDVLQGRFGNREPMSYREAHQHLLQNYMLQLKSAPFDIKDDKLLPKVGACGPCPKRTGNSTDLFGDVKGADVCTDPKCFDDKRQAHYSVAVRELEAKGNKVIAGDKAKKAFPEWESTSQWSRDRLQGGYVALEDTTYASGRNRKVSELLGADYEPILIQHPGTGKIIKAATQQAIAAAAQKASKTRAPAKKGSSKPREAKPDPAELLHKKIFMHVLAAIPKKLGADELRWIARELLFGDVDFELIEEVLLPPQKGTKTSFGAAQRRIEAIVPKLDIEGLSRLAIATYLSADYDGEKRLPEAAKLYGVDLAAVKAAVKAEEKEAAEKAPPKKKAKK